MFVTGQQLWTISTLDNAPPGQLPTLELPQPQTMATGNWPMDKELVVDFSGGGCLGDNYHGV